jgi:hypothetical protein
LRQGGNDDDSKDRFRKGSERVQKGFRKGFRKGSRVQKGFRGSRGSEVVRRIGLALSGLRFYTTIIIKIAPAYGG